HVERDGGQGAGGAPVIGGFLRRGIFRGVVRGRVLGVIAEREQLVAFDAVAWRLRIVGLVVAPAGRRRGGRWVRVPGGALVGRAVPGRPRGVGAGRPAPPARRRGRVRGGGRPCAGGE